MVDVEEGRALVPQAGMGKEAACLVATGWLDLDDVGALVGQMHGAEGGSPHAGQVQHLDAFQGSRHEGPPHFKIRPVV